MVLYLGVIIASIIGFTKSGKFTSSFDGATCSMINFLEHLTKGEDKTDFPKWIGTNNIVAELENLDKVTQTVEDEYPNVFEANDYTTLGSKITDYEDNKIPNIKSLYKGLPNPQTTAMIYPFFVVGFKEQTGVHTIEITEEFKTLIKTPYDTINQLKEVSENIKANKTGVSNSLSSFKVTFNNIESTVSNVSEPAIDNILKVRDKAFDLFLFAFKILYGILLVLAIALMTLLSLYVWVKLYILKFSTHVIWNVGMVICFLTLLIGSIIGVACYIFKAISPSFTYLLSKEYLSDPSSLFSQTGDVADYIDICLNRDGDLIKGLGVSTTAAQNLEELNTVSRTVQSMNLSLPNSSPVFASILEEMQRYKADLSTVTNYETHRYDDIQKIIDSINAETDENHVCKAYDYYATTIEKCKEGYTYQETFQSTGKNCYILPNSNLVIAYTACTLDSIKSKLSYINRIGQLLDDTIDSIKTNYVEPFNLLLQDVHAVYESSDSITNPIIEDANNSVGPNNKLFSIFNCSYLSHDLIQFINQFHNKFTSACKDVAISCVCGSIFAYAAVYFLIRALQYYGPNSRKNELNTEEKGMNENNENGKAEAQNEDIINKGPKPNNTLSQKNTKDSTKIDSELLRIKA